MFKKHTKKQNIIILSFIVSILFLTSLPNIVGWLMSAGDHFLAGNHLNQGDVLVYVSNIEQVKQGKILVANLFTSENQRDIFFTPLWLGLGFLAQKFLIDSFLIFQLARIATGFLFLLFVYYYFLELFFTKFHDKLIAFSLICFSSGLGLLFRPYHLKFITDPNLIWHYFPADLLLPEGNTFLSLAHSSLFVISQLLIVLIFYFCLIESNKKIYWLYLLGLALLLGFIHTYDIIIVICVLGVYFLLITSLNLLNYNKLKIKGFLIKYLFVILGFFPALCYFYFILSQEVAIWGWLKQNVTISPDITSYLIAFGFLMGFSLISLYINRQRFNKKIYFLLSWILVIFVLIYSPFQFQRKLINSIHIALSILAAYSVIELIKVLAKIYKYRILYFLTLFIFLFFISLSNFAFLITSIYDYQHLRKMFYFPQEYYQASLWLKNHSLSSQVILAGNLNGASLPAIIARPVYLGHPHQTIDYKNKKDKVENWFFQEKETDEIKQKFLQKNNISYIFYTDREAILGDYNLSEKDFVEEVFNNQKVIIYKVIY